MFVFITNISTPQFYTFLVPADMLVVFLTVVSVLTIA